MGTTLRSPPNSPPNCRFPTTASNCRGGRAGGADDASGSEGSEEDESAAMVLDRHSEASVNRAAARRIGAEHLTGAGKGCGGVSGRRIDGRRSGWGAVTAPEWRGRARGGALEHRWKWVPRSGHCVADVRGRAAARSGGAGSEKGMELDRLGDVPNGCLGWS